MSVERRQAIRVPGPFEAIWDGQSGGGVCRLSDLSEDGCFIESLCAPDKGEQIEVMATLAAHQLRLRGRVIYVVPAVGFGVAFLRSDDTAARTRQVLEEVAS